MEKHEQYILLEKLAELEHEQWAHIINYLLKEGMLHLGRYKTSVYRQLAKTPYSKLSEGQKESDREWAKKTLQLIEQSFQKLENELRKEWEAIAEFEQKFYPTWLSADKPRLLFSTALAGEIGEVCGVVTHLDGGGTNNRKYTERMLLHQCVDAYIQLVLLLEKSGFTYADFEKEFWKVLNEELPKRLEEKTLRKAWNR